MDNPQAQAAKLARGWVWQSGQMAVATVRPDPSSDFSRTGTMRVDVSDGKLTTLVGCWWRQITDATPVVDDPATADGLPRTCRAMWDIPLLYSSPPRGDSHEWSVGYDWEDMGSIVTVGRGATETTAWLAACYAAPEHA